MNWSSVTIFLALLFASAYSQRGGRRYLPDQPVEESLAVENHRFQTRSRGDVEDARRGDGRRARIQETTEINSRSLKSRTRGTLEKTRQFHSHSGREQENNPTENRQLISRRIQETDTKKFTSREDARNERFKSRESSATTESATKNQNFVRGKTRAESRDVEYKTRGTETNRFSSRGVQERGDSSRINQDSVRHKSEETRRSDRDRSQIIRKNNVIETPKNIEPVTERFHSRQPPKEELQKSIGEDATHTNVQSNDNPPITEVKIQDFTSKDNSIEIEKRTRPVAPVTEKFHSRQLARDESRRSRINLSTEKTDFSHIRGRQKTQELPVRGGGSERRRTRPTDSTVTERFHSRQLTREEFPAKRGRFDISTTEKSLRNNKYSQITGSRKTYEITSRGNGIGFEKKGPAEIASTERFHSRQLVRDKLKNNRIEDATTESYKAPAVNTEAQKTSELPNKDVNAVEAESKVQTENVASEQTTESKVELDNSKPITSQPELLSTENTVDFPIKSNDVEEPNRTSRKLESDIPERNSYHRGQNRDFESSKRGRLESSLSRERTRNLESSVRRTEGHRSSRRFTTQSPEVSKENDDSRRKVQRLPSRTRYTDASNVRGRHKIEETSIRQRTVESPISRLRNNERTPGTVLLPEPVTESKLEATSTTEILIRNEQKNEVTIGIPTETSVTSTQRALGRDTNRKSGNRGRGQFKETKALDEKEHSGEVRDDDNYPEVYKQLKKSGTDPKDILALLKARKEVREKLEKKNSKIPQPDASLQPSRQPVYGTDESITHQLQEVTAPYSNFKLRNYKSETLNQRVGSKFTKIEETETVLSSTEKNERFSNFRSRFKQQKLLNQNKDPQATTSTINEFNSEEKQQRQKVENTQERKYNPYNYQEIRSFNRKKSSSVPTQRNANYRNTLKTYNINDEPKEEEKTGRQNNEFLLNDEQDPQKHRRKTSSTVPGVSRFRSTLKNSHEDIATKEENIPTKNNDLIETDNEQANKKERISYKGPGRSRFRSTLRNKKDEKKESNQKNELDAVNEETSERERSQLPITGSGINRYRNSMKNKNREFKVIDQETESKPNNEETETVNKETSVKVRKLGFTRPAVSRFRNTLKTRQEDKISEEEKDKNQKDELIESETSKPSRTSFTGPGISKSNTRKENSIESPGSETQTENSNVKSKYIPRNREQEYEKFKARTEKTLADVSTESSIKPNYNIYNRNEHSSFRRRSFSTSTSEGTDILSTVQYKNSITPRARPTYVPQRKTFVKSTSTLAPLPLSRYRARKISLSRLFNEEDLKVDNSEDHKLTFIAKEEDNDDLRPHINDLSIDSLVSESEQSSYTTEGGVVSSARKRSRYTESHIQKVPPKRRGSESYKFFATSTSSKPEVYTVVGIPYYEEGTSLPPDTLITTTEYILDPANESTTTLIETIPTTTPITTTDMLSTTDTPSTSTIIITTSTTTEIPTTSTTRITTTETTTIASTTTTEPTTPSTTTEPTTPSTTTTEPTTASITTTEPTTVSTTATEATTTTTTHPTTTKRLTSKSTITTKQTTRKPKIATTTKVHTTVTTHPPPIVSTKTFVQQKSSITTRKITTPTPKTTGTNTRKTTVTSTTKPTTKKITPTLTTKATPKTTKKQISTPYSTPATSKVTQLSTTFKIDELLSTKHPNFLSTIAYIARNLTVHTTPYDNANTANFRASTAHAENTTPMQHQTTEKIDNYVVYGLLPNNNVVRKVVKTTKSPLDVPFYIYGLYPNGTIVRRFPNGTVVPDETEEENEIIGSVEPGSQESLETVVKKDNPLSYLYPPGYEKTTKTINIPSVTTQSTRLNKDESIEASTTELLSIDPRIAPFSSNIEKPATAKSSGTTTMKLTTTKSTTKFTTTKPTTGATTSKSTTKPTTAKTTTKKATMKSTTTKSTTKVTTMKPLTKPSTIKTTSKLPLPTTVKPSTTKYISKTTMKPAPKPTFKQVSKATTKATTTKSTTKATTTKSTTKATTTKPIPKSTITKPIPKSITTKPTPKATTTKPTPKATITKSTPKATTTKSTPKTTTTKPTLKGTTTKHTTKTTTKTKGTTVKPQNKVSTTKPSTTTASLTKTQANKSATKATTKVSLSTTTKRSITTSKGSLSKPPKPTTKPTGKIQEKSTVKTLTTPLSDAELLNNLLKQEGKNKIPKGTTESTALLADKVIQLAIERAQKSTTVPPFLKDISSTKNLQLLSPSSSPVTKQPSGSKQKINGKKLIDDANTNKTGKISLWVIPPEESTTSKPSNGVSKSEIELLNALLASPNAIENLSLSEQLILADVLSSTALPQTTRKKKKKSRTTTTTTTPPPPAFPILQYLFGRNRGGGGGLFQGGLFRGGGLRGLESGSTLPQEDGGLFQNDGLPQGQGELAAESQNDPQEGDRGGLVSAAINVSRAVSQFMGYVIQGASQSFQNYFQTRTRALTDALSYPAAT